MEHRQWKGLGLTGLIPVFLLFPLKPLPHDCHVYTLLLPKNCWHSSTVGACAQRDCPPGSPGLHLHHCPSCLPPSSHPLHHPTRSPTPLKINGRHNIDLGVQESDSKKCMYRPLITARRQPFRDAVESSLSPLLS